VSVLKRLFGYVRPYWKPLVATGVLLLLNTGLSLLPPLFQRDIVDQVIGTRDLSRLGTLVATLVGVYVLLWITEVGDQYTRHVLGARFIFDLRMHIYAYLQRLSLSFFERTSTGELMSRVTNDVNAMENFVTHGVILTSIDLLRLVGASAVLLVLDYRLALIVLVLLPIMAVGLRWFNQRVRRWRVDGHRRAAFVGHAGGLSCLRDLLLRPPPAADGGGQHLPAGHCLRGAHL